MESGASNIIARRCWTRVAFIKPHVQPDLAQALWEAPQDVVAAGEPLRKVAARSTVRLRWQNEQFVLKHYVESTLRHSLKQNVSRSRARTTWTTAHRLAEAGIATPQPVACIENRFGPFRGDSYLMYPYIEGQTLRSYLGCEESPARPIETALRDQLVVLWRRLKELRVSLADTNLKNFIVGEAGRLWVIDVDKARFHRVEFVAARSYERAWRQLTRSAFRTGGPATRFVTELRERLGFSG